MSTIITTLSLMLQVIVLTNILGPNAFGLIALVNVVIGFAQSFSDMGVSNAIIRCKNNTREKLSTLFWFNILVGIAIFAIIILASPLVVSFYNNESLYNLIFWAAVTFLIMPFGQLYQALLQKNMSFRSISIIEIIATFTGALLSIAMAYGGLGVISLIWGQIITATIKAIGFSIAGKKFWKPMLHFNTGDFSEYLEFGLYQMGERCVNYFTYNIDVIIIGKFLGPSVLGFYSIAYQIIIMPLYKINPILTTVAFPLFSKYQDDNSILQSGYKQISATLGFISFPIIAGLSLTSQVYVPIVLGNNWEPSIILIQILSIVGLAKTLANPTGTIYLAKGYANFGFLWNVFVAIFNAIVFYTAIQYGIVALALSYAVLSIIYLIILQTIVCRMIDLKLSSYFESFKYQLFSTLIMGLVVYASYRLFIYANVYPIFILMALILIGIFAYAILQYKLNKPYLYNLRSYIVNNG